MIRSKHILILVALILLVLVAILITLVVLPGGKDGDREQGAQLFTAHTTASVTTSERGTTDDARASLLEKLRALGPHPVAVATKEEVAVAQTPVIKTRTRSVTRPDGSTVTVIIPYTGTIVTPRRELTSDIVGVALNGTWIYNSDVARFAEQAGTQQLLGYAFDGFGIYADDGSMNLDVCHGHTHLIEWNGSTQIMYHYHVSTASPLVLGCFSGEPIDLGPYL
ncbi:hypothetical protein GW943_03090 [Candidatus Parcubacteria bacterium]|uniref:Uncharacterized protein n=1 Tax=Candidatus Kaiserbacteria bacterium CG10_big_fil_rev_8_21_14_0_10_47_16 TaxID=1974608 RepID=A0A2H0UEP1_9BACT|nr:hypothetical protein [Candidatus Parcubacteria bacterium]PIR84872.1 MAG: hypothetical protein COU16_00600 [Candidatus Kaiserbacteria bacterium CG10_big_fil_rev_8_21_14_0_10_47_16]